MIRMIGWFGWLALAMIIVSGCGSAAVEVEKAVDTVPIATPTPYAFVVDGVTGVKCYLGDDTLVGEWTGRERLDDVFGVFQGSPSFAGEATADLNHRIVVAYADGSERELEVSGGGSIFVDRTTKTAYTLNRAKFDALLKDYAEASAPAVTSSASWAYLFVVYNGSTYVVGSEEVAAIGKEIGEVTSYSDREGTYAGNFSNRYPVGTKFYEIEGTDPSEAIAVEATDGWYVRADYRGQSGGD